MKQFQGVLPALITPLREDESLNAPVLERLIDHLIDEGAYGFYIGGATGEGVLLRRAVREELAERALGHIKGRVDTIVHIASHDFSEAVALAKQAEALGADGISAVPPFYFTYSENEVFEYYKRLAGAVHIPLMCYYTPASSFRFTPAFGKRLFEIDNITAIKWTSADYYGMLSLKDITHGEMNIMNGPDEMLLMGLSAGADGGIGSTYNYQLPYIKTVYEQFKAGNMAAALEAQRRADAVIRVLHKYRTIPAIKAVLQARGFDVGNAVFPQVCYTAEQKAAIVADFRAAGLEI